tara:strand:+ start:445 stop:822 length:378 start_codon:yes stop_codon:yes gene_type:complete
MKKILITIFFLWCSASFSADKYTTFTNEIFQKAQADGKIIVINSWDRWCPVCKKQKRLLNQAKTDFKDVLFLTFEHKNNKEIRKLLNIHHFSTIVFYKNGKEVGRGIGDANKTRIYSLIKKLNET